MHDIFATLGIDIPEGLERFEPRVIVGTIAAVSADAALVSFTNPAGKRAVGTLPVTEALRNRGWEVGVTATLLQLDDAPRPLLSAVAPGFVEAILHGVSPEVRDGRVRVMGVARRPGDRCKVAVASTDPNLDAVAAVVGRRHNRVDAVREALGGERVDFVAWHPDPLIYLANALQPAKVEKVAIDPETRTALALTPAHQMAAAVGGRGLNSSLAGRLLGVNVRVEAL